MERRTRRLSAILVTDISGFSHQMETDETGTLDRLKRHNEIIEKEVEHGGGRVFKKMGDAFLVDFSSVVSAVESAVHIQRTFREENKHLKEPIRVRIGVHLGDVVVEGSDVFGTGVNIATRLQELAQPGGICMSEDVYRLIRHQVKTEITSLGERKLRNITEPVHVYQILDTKEAPARAIGSPIEEGRKTLAILPFYNIMQDADLDFLGFSLANEIINELAFIRSLVVRPSSYISKYVDAEYDPQAVSRELRVDYLLTGTFLKAAETVRVTCQLIDITEDQILWQRKLDVNYQNLITLHDLIAHEIIDGLKLSISEEEEAKLVTPKNRSPESYENYLKAVGMDESIPETYLAIGMLKKSLALDPSSARTWFALGQKFFLLSATEGSPQFLDRAEDAFRRALEKNPDHPKAKVGLGSVFLHQGHTKEALKAYLEVLEVAPNSSRVHLELAYLYRFNGLWDLAMQEAVSFREIDPISFLNFTIGKIKWYRGEYDAAINEFSRLLKEPTFSSFVIQWIGLIYVYKGDFNQAYHHLEQALEMDPENMVHILSLATAYSAQGELAKGRALAQTILDRTPIDGEVLYWLVKYHALQNEAEEAVERLRKAIQRGYRNYPWIVKDPLLKPLHDNADFKTVLEELESWHRRFQKEVGANLSNLDD
jgi:class 3 adenylate cyclase/tetratricopeptide (TPR) repeat protein